jgi:hypothetical protein
MIPPEPPVAALVSQNGAQRARARRFSARRSEPLPESTVLAVRPPTDGRIRRDLEALMHPAGEL